MLNNIKIDIPESFLTEEIRCDYLVSESMKKVWAVQLDLLSELKRVCDDNGLTYFADSGTLLGAIRHKGYIPWDDDIDIVMKREDYDKLIKLGAKEFQEPYFLQSAHSEIFPRGYARLRNSYSTAITRYDYGKNINCGIFIDIFPLDNIPDEMKIRKKWLKKIKTMLSIITTGYAEKTKEYSGFVRTLEYYFAKVVVKIWGYRNIIKHYEDLCSKYNGIETQKISYVAYSNGPEKHIWDRSCFDSFHAVPFEFTEINIPDGYDARLRVEYKDYMKLVRASNTHGSMILEPEMPFKQYFIEHTEDEIKRQLASF